MWKTVKAIKKILLLQLDNIKNSSINLPNLTFGLKWSSINFMIGNCRLLTYNKENKITLNGNAINNDTISIEVYNTKYKSNSVSMGVGVGREVTIPTSIDHFYVRNLVDWEGSGYISDVDLDIGLEIYGINDRNEKILIQKNVMDTDSWSSYGGYYEDCFDDMCWAYANGTKSISYVVQLNDVKFKYNKLNIKIYYIYEGNMMSYRYQPMYIDFIDTTQELERTSTDIHLIAWEES